MRHVPYRPKFHPAATHAGKRISGWHTFYCAGDGIDGRVLTQLHTRQGSSSSRPPSGGLPFGVAGFMFESQWGYFAFLLPVSANGGRRRCVAAVTLFSDRTSDFDRRPGRPELDGPCGPSWHRGMRPVENSVTPAKHPRPTRNHPGKRLAMLMRRCPPSGAAIRGTVQDTNFPPSKQVGIFSGYPAFYWTSRGALW
jgi:hypothetical protein